LASEWKQHVQLKGFRSQWLWVPVESRKVPFWVQFCFLIFFTDDLDTDISSTVLKCTDHSKVVGKANCNTDSEEMIWLSYRNALTYGKCNLILINAKFYILTTIIRGLHTKWMAFNFRVWSQKETLGVIVSNDLMSTKQCVAACNKANRILELIKRTVVSRDESILIAVYKNLVRQRGIKPLCLVTRLQKDKSSIERIQHRFTGLFTNLRHLDYSYRLEHPVDLRGMKEESGPNRSTQVM